jgi:hypothetical protein
MPMTWGGSKFLTLDELRAEFPEPHKPSKETIRRYIRKGLIQGRKFGTGWYVSTRAMERFLEGQPAEPLPPGPEPSAPVGLAP